MAATTTTQPPRCSAIKCPIFTYSGYDASSETFYCEYRSWAYGVFAIASILIIVLPVLTIVCCLARYRSRKRYLRRLTSSDSCASPIDRPLLPEEIHHNDAVEYGSVEAFPPPTPEADSTSGRPSGSHDSVSIVSSRASLVPNYDQSSLDYRNTKTGGALQNCYDYQEPIERLAPPGNAVSPYMVCNINPRNKVNSPIYVVPEEASPKVLNLPEPEHVVLEKPGDSTDEDKKTVNKLTTPDDEKLDQSPTAVQDDRVKSALECLQSIVEGLDDEPESNVTLRSNCPISTLVYNEGHNKEAEDNILEPTKPSGAPEDLDDKEEPEKNLLVDDKVNTSLLDEKQEDACSNSKGKNNEGFEGTDEQRYMPLVFPKPTKETTIPLNRTKSRSDFQEILLDGVKMYPLEERNGCFVLRDSVSSPGSKVLTIYCKTPDSQQEFYNFKVCFDDPGVVYLAKSMKRFPTVEELLDYLRLNKDILPCPLRSQITYL